MAELIAVDSTNTRSLTDAVASAEALAADAVKQNRKEDVLRWRAVMSQRLDAVFARPTTDMRYLTARAEYSVRCAKLHSADDWPKARHHYEALLIAKKRMTQLDPSQTDLDSYVDAVFAKIKDHEGESIANAWLAKFKQDK